MIGLYVLSYILSKKKIISEILHKRIWNILLLISFLKMGVLGLLLVLKIQYNFTLGLPFNMLFWHVEFGIIMTLISIFHIIWHFNYYKNIFFNKNKKTIN